MNFEGRLQPAPREGGFKLDDQWIWCGSVIRGDDGLFHMFASMWSKETPFNPNWLTNSRVVRATSATPEGPYTYADEVLPPRGAEYWDGMMTHNPTIHKSGDTYLLYYTGTTYQGEMPDGEHPEVSDAMRTESRANQRIGLATAPSPAGPWTRYDKPVLEPRPGKWDALMTTNAAPLVRPDGSVLMLYKATDGNKGIIQYGGAEAPSYDAPFERIADDPIFDFDFSYEDAYIWHEDGEYRMLFNDMTGRVTGEDHAGAFATSDDGITWTIAASPKGYSRYVLWDDGETTHQGSFERPQILMQDGRATHLFAATSDGATGFWDATKTWNMVRPLKDA